MWADRGFQNAKPKYQGILLPCTIHIQSHCSAGNGLRSQCTTGKARRKGSCRGGTVEPGKECGVWKPMWLYSMRNHSCSKGGRNLRPKKTANLMFIHTYIHIHKSNTPVSIIAVLARRQSHLWCPSMLRSSPGFSTPRRISLRTVGFGEGRLMKSKLGEGFMFQTKIDHGRSAQGVEIWTGRDLHVETCMYM